MPEQIARQSAVRVNLSSVFPRNTPVRFAVAHLLCYGLRRGESRNDFRRRSFSLLCRFGTSPQGVDTLSTG